MKRSDYRQWEHKRTPLLCPFCGKAPVVGPGDPAQFGDAWAYVQCQNRLCPVQPTCKDGAKVSDMRGPGAYRDLAIKRWNRRATPTAETEEAT